MCWLFADAAVSPQERLRADRGIGITLKLYTTAAPFSFSVFSASLGHSVIPALGPLLKEGK